MPWLPEPEQITTGISQPFIRASDPAAAQARAADLEVVALFNGVCLVQQRINGAGDSLAGVGVQRLIAVDQHAQEPVRAFLFKADIPQAQVHPLNNGADERFDDLDRAALLRFTGFCHKNAPIIKRKRTLRPTFSKIIIEH